MKADNVCKLLCELAPSAPAAWLLDLHPDQLGLVLLESPDLPTAALRADVVLRLPERSLLLHIEFQTVFSTDVPRRMFSYFARLVERYGEGVLIRQAVVVLTPGGSRVRQVYEHSGTVHRFRVVKLWEQDAAVLLEHEALAPFAVLARWREGEPLAGFSAWLQRVGDRRQRADLATGAAVLGRLKFSQAQVERYLPETVMMESPFYKEILARGKLEGKAEAEARAVLRTLEVRFGAVPQVVRETILRAEQAHDLLLLEAMLEAALRTPNLDAFEATLAQLRGA
ncbi:MAG: hypothetical protein NZ693_11260 [Thermoflexales bacterium]|nr:hypothetical protein [Thermoflexales bacterium]